MSRINVAQLHRASARLLFSRQLATVPRARPTFFLASSSSNSSCSSNSSSSRTGFSAQVVLPSQQARAFGSQKNKFYFYEKPPHLNLHPLAKLHTSLLEAGTHKDAIAVWKIMKRIVQNSEMEISAKTISIYLKSMKGMEDPQVSLDRAQRYASRAPEGRLNDPANAQTADLILREIIRRGYTIKRIHYHNLMRAYGSLGDFHNLRRVCNEMLLEPFEAEDAKAAATAAAADDESAEEGASHSKTEKIVEGLGEEDEMKLLNSFQPQQHDCFILIEQFGRHGNIKEMEEVFSNMLARGIQPDQFIYVGLMSGYAKAQELEKMEKTFRDMIDAGIAPTVQQFAVRLGAFRDLKDFNRVEQIVQEFTEMRRAEIDTQAKATATAAAAAAAGGEQKPTAEAQTETHAEAGASAASSKRARTYPTYSLIPWNAPLQRILLDVYSLQKNVEKVMSIAKVMMAHPFSQNSLCYHAILVAYARIGRTEDALRLYEQMMKNRRTQPLEMTFSAVLSIHLKENNKKAVAQLLKEMKKRGFSPNAEVYQNFMDASRREKDLSKVRDIFDELVAKDMKPDISIYNTLLLSYAQKADSVMVQHYCLEIAEKGLTQDSYTYFARAKCAYADKSYNQVEEIFAEMLAKKVQPSIQNFVITLQALQAQWKFDKAVELFERMQTEFGIKPNTFALNNILAFCARVKKMEEAEKYFTMFSDFQLNRDRYTMISLLLGYAKLHDIAGAERTFQRTQDENLLDPTHVEVMLGTYVYADPSPRVLQKVKSIYDKFINDGHAPTPRIEKHVRQVYEAMGLDAALLQRA